MVLNSGNSPAHSTWGDIYDWLSIHPNVYNSSDALEVDRMESFCCLSIRSEPTTPEVCYTNKLCLALLHDAVDKC